MSTLPTIIVVHPKERRKKCTVEPLRGRPEFCFVRYTPGVAAVPEGYVRLGLGGPELSAADRDSGLLLLDGTWRYAAQMERDYAAVPVRTLPPLQTALPRRSKLFEDPEAGLATIEALFAAHVILGRPLQGLLDAYRWAKPFLERNAQRLRAVAAEPAELQRVLRQFAGTDGRVPPHGGSQSNSGRRC